MAAIDISFDGDHLIRTLAAARQHLGDGSIMTSIGLSLLAANTARHKAGEAPDGSAWTPLKPATIKRKKNPRMLVEEGDMLRFYSHPSHNAVTIGTADRKAFWHHAGTTRKPPRWLVLAGAKNYLDHSRRGLPARPLVGFAEADNTLVKELIADHLLIILRRGR